MTHSNSADSSDHADHAPSGARGRSFLRRGAPILVLALLLVASFTAAPAQYIAFGKNKVQYSTFNWRVLESAHIHLYYYEEERELAEQALAMAEDSYLTLQARFVHDVGRPIPLIVYSSHQDFEQTNVTPGFMPEGVAGLTEFAKGRVLIPFDGSLIAFRTTIQHELVHVFQLSVGAQVFREHFRNTPLSPPLWFTEGLAVHWSEDRDTEADMILRDMVFSGSLPGIPEFWRYEGGYIIYKLGQSVCDYIGLNFGEDRIRLLYERLWVSDSFDGVIQDVLGISVRELSDRWTYDLKQRYFPQVDAGRPVGFLSHAVTSKGGADFKALPLPDSLPGLEKHFAFLSPRSGFTNIYTASMAGKDREKDVRTLVDGERKPEFESFHAFRSRMDVSPDGILLFVSKHRERDEIVLYSVTERKEIERHAFPRLVGISSPCWAPGPERFIFSGLSQDGYSDLFLFDRKSAELTRLTTDRYQDLDPAYCEWNNTVVFSSDRTPWGLRGKRNLFELHLASGEVRHLTRGDWNDSAPGADPERRAVLFVSDRSGFYNVYRIGEDGLCVRLTKSLDAITDPRPVPKERRFLATVFQNGRFHIRSFPLPPDTLEPRIQLAAADSTYPWDWRNLAPPVSFRNASYTPKFTLDVAQGGVLFDPGTRTGEGMQAAFSDMMGNHLIFVGLGNTTFSTTDFLSNLSGAVTYVNLSRRLNYGVTAFHYTGDFIENTGFPYSERQAGAGLLLRYPLSKFERVESELNAAYQETDRPSVGFRRSGPVSSQTVSFIRDTSLWLMTGPIDGQRLNLTAGLNLNLRNGRSENTMLLGDWRRYHRLGLYSGYALRLQGRWSQGTNPQIYTLGGSHSLRVWPRRSFQGDRSVLINQEIRFPLARGLVLGLPMGDLELPGIQGAIFADAGTAWYRGENPEWRGSTGFGLRMGFGGYLVLRFDVGRQTDFKTLDKHTRSEFYLGWNY